MGSIVRSKGGIALQSTLNLTAGTLLAAAQVCPGPAQLWLLHGMWLIVNSAGPAFLPHVTVSPAAQKTPLVTLRVRPRSIKVFCIAM